MLGVVELTGTIRWGYWYWLGASMRVVAQLPEALEEPEATEED